MEQPIEVLMKTTLENIKSMIDVNTVIGDPVETPDGTVIIPVSKVGFGFVSGGGDFKISDGSYDSNETSTTQGKESAPFTGGSGAGVSVYPVGFLSVSQGHIRMIPVTSNIVIDRIIDLLPKFMDNYCKKEDKNQDT